MPESRDWAFDVADWDYQSTLTVTNNSGGALVAIPVPVQFHPSGLIAGGFLSSDARDALIVDAGVLSQDFVVQGMASATSTLWLDTTLIADASTEQYVLYTGNAAATRDQRFRFSGADYITVPSDAALDFTTNLYLSADVDLITFPVPDTYLLNKSGAYGIGFRSGNELFGQANLGAGPADYTDSSPNSNTFTPAGAPVFDPAGAIVGSVSLDGTSDYLDGGTAAAIDDIFVGGGTVEFYVNLDAITDNDVLVQKIIEPNVGWWVYEEAGGCGAGTTYLYFKYNFDTADGGWKSDACVLTTAAGWQRVSITYDQDDVANNPLFYLAGVGIALTEFETPVGTASSDATASFEVGYAATPTISMDGQVDDVRLWSDTRTPVEIAAVDNVALAGTEAGLVAYWMLNSLPTEVTFAPLVINTTYNVALSYDAVTLTLWVDDVAVDTESIVGSIQTTTAAISIGLGSNGHLDNASIGTFTGGSALPYESYITGDDGNRAFYFAVFSWLAQTFTPTTSHTITSVNLKLLRTAGSVPGTVTVSIKAVDGTGKPTGADLAVGTTNGDTITTVSPGEWRLVSLGAGTPLTSGTVYAIVVKSSTDDGAKPIYWRKDATASAYAGGSVAYSVAPPAGDGSPWTLVAAEDAMFEEYGPVAFGGLEVAKFAFEPDELVETQQGNSGNAWTWEGTVEDVIAGAHNSTYTLVRDTSGITAYLGGVELTDIPTVPSSPVTTDVLGTLTANPAAVSPDSNFPGSAILRSGLGAFAPFVSAGAIWFTMTTALAFMIGLGLWMASKGSDLLSVGGFIACYWVVWAIGSPLTLGMTALMTIFAVSCVIVFKTMRREYS
jgi:hypothetical protein